MKGERDMPNFKRRITLNYRLRLKEIRVAKGFKQAQEFAEFLGVSRPEMSRWENGQVWPTLQMALYVADKLKVKVEDLVEKVPRTLAGPKAQREEKGKSK